MEKGDFILEFLGFGFDALNGSALITVMALIKDVNIGENLKSELGLTGKLNLIRKIVFSLLI